jgi:hypothetical protein
VDKLKQIWEILSSRGVENFPREVQKKIARVNNQFFLFYGALMLCLLVYVSALSVKLLLLNKEKYVSLLLPYYTAGLLPFFTILICYYFRKKSRSNILLFLPFVAGVLHVVAYSIFLGPDAGYHYYLISSFVVPFFSHSRRQIKALLFSCGFPLIAFFFIIFWHNNYLPLYPFQPEINKFIFGNSILWLIVTIIVDCFLFWRANNVAQEILERQKKQLQRQARQLEAANRDLLDINDELRSTRHGLKRVALPVRIGNEHHVLAYADILYLSAHGKKTVIYTHDDAYEVSKALGDIEKSLSREVFQRIHRSSIVNVTQVSQIKHMGGGSYIVALKDADRTPLILSRSLVNTLKRRLGLSV